MKDTIVSNCETKFVTDVIKHNLRLDGRSFDEFRKIELHFGSDYGCTYVTLGETKVIAQVSCELAEPRSIRQNEGNLFINLEISDMVCGNFETGHQSHLSVHANRLLEKCIKESRCIDLEALCIISGEQAWEIRVDITVLNYDGNLHTCCSVAALAALSHFKTPHVTLENSEIKVHSLRDHEPQALSIHHFPILVSFAVFCEGHSAIIDPTELEEKVSEAELVFGMNSYRELCGLHFRGNAIAGKDLMLSAASRAAIVAMDLIKMVKDALEVEKEKRNAGKGKTPGLTEAIHLDRVLSACQDRNSLKLPEGEILKALKKFEEKMVIKEGGDSEEDDDSGSDSEDDEESGEEEEEEGEEEKKTRMEPVLNREQKALIDRRKGAYLEPMIVEEVGKNWVPTGTSNAWETPNAFINEDEDSSSSSDDDVNYVKTITDEDRIIDKIELSGDSEEETVVVMEGKDIIK